MTVLKLNIKMKLERGVGEVRKKLPIGIDGFEKLRTNDFYYVDKTLFTLDRVLNCCKTGVKSIYLPRPRRFGKSLNIGMLKLSCRLEAIRSCLLA